MMRSILVTISVLALASSAMAGSQWMLTTSDFRGQTGVLNSIDAAGIHLTLPGGDEKVVPLNQFLDLHRSTAGNVLGGKFALHLVTGDMLGGEPVAVKGNDLLWNSPILGEVAVPMKQLLSLTRPGAASPDSRRREDVVTLANGDTLRGIVADFANGKLTVQGDAGNTDVPLISVSQISFAASAGSTAPANGFRVKFTDGSSLVADSVTVADDKLNMVLRKGDSRSVDLQQVIVIEQVNGPVSWLSSRPTSESIYIPFFGPAQMNMARMDRNWSGLDPIRFGTQEYAHGIGVHSYSRLSWNLDGTYLTFRTRYAIDTKDANTQADVTVRVLLDGKPVYEQAHVRAGTLSPVVVESLTGAKKLTLEVDYGDNMDTQDRLNWIEPALLKENLKAEDTNPK